MPLLHSIFIISSCHFILFAIKKINYTLACFYGKFFTTSHTSKEILKLKYSVNYKPQFTTFDYSGQKIA